MTNAPEQGPGFEDQLARLKDVVAALEKGDVPLESAVRLYKEGLTLSRQCRQRLETARHEIDQLAREDARPASPVSPQSQGDA